ncbi:fatty acyl-AMP ligase [Benzoatithermus flavus]|uniref:Fatty acyl-AMP ligase n=1 Tax=Benzoatithermus flavus TaxID=3108223 RepID=A0ABU8XME5_9PROT
MKPTPTTNPLLPFRAEGFDTLAAGLDYAAQGETGFNFFSARGELVEVLPYRTLRERALDLASRLAGRGLDRGDRVAIVAETSADFVTTFFACQYAGLVPVPLPLCINIGGHDAYVQRLRGMLVSASARLAVAPGDLVATLKEAAETTGVVEVATAAEIATWPAADEPVAPLGPDEPCYIQYSSGSTSFPRGVLVTQRAIAANAHAISVYGLKLGPTDRCTSWLPLYHDMGLVGCCLTPVMNQITVDYLPSTAFARRPLLWLKLLSDLGGTISFGPTFGYELCTRRAQSGVPEGLDLSRWRVAGIGGEMIRGNVLAEFAERFREAGFDERAFLPSYGLAEATLAVTFAPLGQGVAVDTIDRGRALEVERRAVPVDETRPARAIRSFVLCGRPMPGYAVEIRDGHGRALPERCVGRVCIKGPSLMQGYFRNDVATHAVLLEDGWLDSGDMGYLVDGQLVITGRTKDLIIVGGRNIWPQDVEWAVEQLDGVRAGDVAAFAVNGDDDRERVVVVVQCRAMLEKAQEELRAAVAAVVRRVAGVECEVVLAPTRSLTFTTSGKLSRAAVKADYLSGAIRDVTASPERRARAQLEQLAVAS